MSYGNWAAIPAGYNRKDLVLPGPLAGSGNKIVGLQAWFADTPAQTVAINVTLTPIASPLKAMLRGPSGDVRTDRTIVLNASSSVDPDDPANTQPFAVNWDCQRADFPTPCFTGTSYGMQRGLTWMINGSALQPGVQHTFTATISKPGRTANAAVVVTPTQAAIPTGNIRRVCSALCPPRHNSDVDLALSLALDAGSAGATIAWSSDSLPNLANFNGKGDIIIPASSLPSSGKVTITATLTNAGISSKTSIDVDINGKPLCSIVDTCLALTAISTAFPAASFSAAVNGITDDMDTNLLR